MARIEGQRTDFVDVVDVDCLAGNAVGQWVHITGPRIAGRIQVDAADRTDAARRPAWGIIIEKPTATTARVQINGSLTGVLTALSTDAADRTLYLGLNGATEFAAPATPTEVQTLGTVVAEDEIVVAPDWTAGGGGGAANVNIVPFTDSALVIVAHNLGRRPVVQVLQERLDGLYGEGGFGGGGYGSGAGIYTPLPTDVHQIYHVTANSFEVRMSNLFTGEVLYI